MGLRMGAASLPGFLLTGGGASPHIAALAPRSPTLNLLLYRGGLAEPGELAMKFYYPPNGTAPGTRSRSL